LNTRSGKLHFRLAPTALADNKRNRKPPSVTSEEKDGNAKLEAAKAYLTKHGLELRLKEAMQRVINELPDDPVSFISDRLKESEGVVTRKDYNEFKKSDKPLPVTVSPLTDGQAPASEDSELRQQAKLTLIDASSSGRLDAALASMKQAKSQARPRTEELRQQARQSLLEASSSGRFDAALANMKKMRSQALPQTEELREQAKQILLEATSSGRLDVALSSIQKSKSQSQTEELRQQAKQTLLEATSSGRLDAALANVQQSKSESQTEALRQNAKRTLVDATSSGRLDAVLADVKQSKSESMTEDFRRQAKQALLEATSSGQLNAALASVKQAKSESQTEDLRQQAKQTLLEATSSGHLDAALAKVKQSKSESLVEDSRQAATPTLLEAISAGQSEAALAEVKQTKPEPQEIQATSPNRLDAEVGRIKVTPTPEQVEEVQKAVLEVVKDCAMLEATSQVTDAMGFIRAEMQKRDEQAALLANQMSGLTSLVADLQETVRSNEETVLFGQIDMDQDGNISRDEFRKALRSGIISPIGGSRSTSPMLRRPTLQ